MLILKDRKKQVGDLPGGRMDQGEMNLGFAKVVARELSEELGNIQYKLHQEPLFVFPHLILDGGHEALGIVFYAHYLGGKISLSDEHDFMEWVKIESYEPDGFYQDSMSDAVKRFQKEYWPELRTKPDLTSP